MYLFIDTSNPDQTKIGLANSAGFIDSEIWPCNQNQSEELLGKVDDLLKKNQQQKRGISGIIAMVGPGSYTGLRVGLATVNALSYAWRIPVAGMKSDEAKNTVNFAALADRLSFNQLEVYYERPPHITAPKRDGHKIS